MTLTWYGQSCFKIDTREAVLAIDPFSKEIGLTPPRFHADIVLVTHHHYDHANTAALAGQPVVINGPGEYEVKNITIRGLPSFHDSREGKERGPNAIYWIEAEDITLAHFGDFGESALREETAEALGDIDILLIPVGGTYTINGETATKIIRQIEPRLVIPMHYHLPELKIKLAPIEDFLKSYGSGRAERLEKLSIKKKDLPETETRLVVLARA